MTERYRCTRCTMTFEQVDGKPDYADPQRTGCPVCRLYFWELKRNHPRMHVACYVLRSDVQPARG